MEERDGSSKEEISLEGDWTLEHSAGGNTGSMGTHSEWEELRKVRVCESDMIPEHWSIATGNLSPKIPKSPNTLGKVGKMEIGGGGGMGNNGGKWGEMGAGVGGWVGMGGGNGRSGGSLVLVSRQSQQDGCQPRCVSPTPDVSCPAPEKFCWHAGLHPVQAPGPPPKRLWTAPFSTGDKSVGNRDKSAREGRATMSSVTTAAPSEEISLWPAESFRARWGRGKTSLWLCHGDPHITRGQMGGNGGCGVGENGAKQGEMGGKGGAEIGKWGAGDEGELGGGWGEWDIIKDHERNCISNLHRKGAKNGGK